MQNTSFFDPAALAKLSGLSLRARHIVEGYVAGLHRSPFHGFSIEFAEHREYSPGDDLRHVDWKVFGRTDKFYLKQYEDETNLVCYLVLDISESMAYKGPNSPLSKLQYAQCVAAAMAHLVLRQQDAVGVATFDEQLGAYVQPSSKASQLQQIIHVLDVTEARKKTSAGRLFHELAERFKKRGVVFILSDLFDDPDTLIAGLKHFQHRRHDCVVGHVLDAAELEFPFTRQTMFRGMEQYPEVIADPTSLRRAYLEKFEEFCSSVQRGCRKFGIDYTLMRTDRPFDVTLANFLSQRSRRVK